MMDLSEVPFEPYYEKDGIVIYNADCRQVLPFLPKFDLLLTDPPYGLGERLKGGNGEWSKGFQENPSWDLETVLEVPMFVKLHKKSIVWGGNYYQMPICRGWFAWDKVQAHTSGHFELAWTNLDSPTRAFRLSRIEAYSRMGKQHPTQKPLSLMSWCIKQAGECETILDPFMGSGTTLVAAKQEGKKAVGIELEEKYCEVAVNRLAQNVLF